MSDGELDLRGPVGLGGRAGGDSRPSGRRIESDLGRACTRARLADEDLIGVEHRRLAPPVHGTGSVDCSPHDHRDAIAVRRPITAWPSGSLREDTYRAASRLYDHEQLPGPQARDARSAPGLDAGSRRRRKQRQRDDQPPRASLRRFTRRETNASGPGVGEQRLDQPGGVVALGLDVRPRAPPRAPSRWSPGRSRPPGPRAGSGRRPRRRRLRTVDDEVKVT